jgi:hypothetical protein
MICGVECVISARWESPSKVVARVGRVAKGGIGDVIVATKSGGIGVCSLHFRVFHVQIGVSPFHLFAILMLNQMRCKNPPFGLMNRVLFPEESHPHQPQPLQWFLKTR